MSWWSRFVRRAALDRDLDRELREHLERRTEALIAAGLTPAQARRQALVESGGVEQVKEAVRDVRGTRWAHDLAQDVRYGARGLLRRPGLLIAATLSLGLGLGANTAVFALVDAILLRALPVRDPASLVTIARGSWTNPIWEEVQRRSEPFLDGAIAWSGDDFDLSRGGEVDRVDGLFVSGTFFEMLGVDAAAGRLLTPADDRRGGGAAGPTAVISHRFWLRRFGGDTSVLGKTLLVDRTPFTIVGVVSPRFTGPTIGRQFDVAVPIGLVDRMRPGASPGMLDARSTWWLQAMFRLRPGQTIDAATAVLRSIQADVRAATVPLQWPPDQQARYLTRPFELIPAAVGRSELRTRYREPLLVLLGMVGVVLLVACANVSNLLLARGEARRPELSARLALGASHRRLVRQLLAESVLLVLPGTALGLALAVWGARFLVGQLATSTSSVALALPIDWRLLAFLAGLALTTGIGFGLVPAWRVRRIDAADAMAHAALARTTRRGIVSGPLVVTQVALSLVLVVAAGLFARTFSALATRDLGFEPDRMIQVSLSIGRAGTADRGSLLARVRDEAARIPGVEATAVSLIEPLSGMGWNEDVDVPGTPVRDADSLTWLNAVTPGWFAAYGTPLVAGRDFDARDEHGSPVAIVNEAFARRFLGGPAALGRRVAIKTNRGESFEIVGVARDAAYDDVRGELPATLYRPLSQVGAPFPFATLTVRAAPGAAGLHAALTRAVTRVDPMISLTYGSLATRHRDQLREARMIALLSGFFGGLALLLAAVGLYGVTSYGVTERRREIGIRLTLGASRAGAQRLVLRRVARQVGIGVALGISASLALTPVLRTQLYQLEPRDPATLTVAAAVLTAVAFVAGWLPARRAARIDPAQVLREG
jgi:predicted permease